MAVAVLQVGTAAKVTWTPTGGSLATLKNSTWKFSREPEVKKSTNTTDGIVRAVGFTDAMGSVTGEVDTTDRIEAKINSGDIGVLKLYTDGTKFFQLTAIIGKLDIETSTDDFEKWSFDFSLQSGSIVEPA